MHGSDPVALTDTKYDFDRPIAIAHRVEHLRARDRPVERNSSAPPEHVEKELPSDFDPSQDDIK
jgi:hypothetical protein